MRTYRKSADALVADVGELKVALNVESLKYFELNMVGSRIWEILENDARSEDDVVSILMDEFDVAEEECRSAVRDFFGHLEAEGLVVSA